MTLWCRKMQPINDLISVKWQISCALQIMKLLIYNFLHPPVTSSRCRLNILSSLFCNTLIIGLISLINTINDAL
jgi:hypothetical protein